MFDYRDFQQVFPAGAQLPYDRNRQDGISDSRKHLDNALFIDRVMKALGLEKSRLFPPTSDNGLRKIHQQICDADMSLHHKFSLLYYILLDFDYTDSRTQASNNFAAASSMPKNYQILMKGLWHLDQLAFEEALEYIAHPSLIPDFADDIIIALVQNEKDGLALSYYHTVMPILTTSTALELLFDAMARTDTTEALLFSRTQPEYIRESLFGRLIVIALSDKQGRSSRAELLAFLPFEGEEEAWFEQHLLHDKAKNMKKAKDTLLIRKIAGDKFNEVAHIKGAGQWGPILEGIKAGTNGQAE